MGTNSLGQLVISHKRGTLSARVIRLENLQYYRYSIFFNQPIAEIGPSHILISKRLINEEYKWVCEERSMIQDEELAQLAGAEIDNLLFSNMNVL
jgi:hypothetical protein